MQIKCLKDLVKTKRDKARACVHEVGHVMIFAACEPSDLPLELKATGYDSLIDKCDAGFLRWTNQHQIVTEDESVFHMFLLLAGYCAEKRVFGDTALSSTHEITQWERLAVDYLIQSTHFPNYFASPRNEVEAEMNKRVLNAFRICTEEVLQKFFKKNADILKELSFFLLEKGQLTCQEIHPFLTKVKLIYEFPTFIDTPLKPTKKNIASSKENAA